jgi:hypothetical protein
MTGAPVPNDKNNKLPASIASKDQDVLAAQAKKIDAMAGPYGG